MFYVLRCTQGCKIWTQLGWICFGFSVYYYMRKLKNSNVERYLDLVKEMSGNGEGQGGEEMNQLRRGGSLPKAQNTLETIWNTTKDIYNKGSDIFNTGAKRAGITSIAPYIGSTAANILGVGSAAYSLLDANLKFNQTLKDDPNIDKSDDEIDSDVSTMYSGIYGSSDRQGPNSFYGSMKKTGGQLPRFQNTGEVIIPSGFGGIDDGNNETYPTRADIQEFHALNADNYRTEALYNQGKVLTDQANELVEHEVDIWRPPLGTKETIIDWVAGPFKDCFYNNSCVEAVKNVYKWSGYESGIPENVYTNEEFLDNYKDYGYKKVDIKDVNDLIEGDVLQYYDRDWSKYQIVPTGTPTGNAPYHMGVYVGNGQYFGDGSGDAPSLISDIFVDEDGENKDPFRVFRRTNPTKIKRKFGGDLSKFQTKGEISDMKTWSYGNDKGLGSLFSPTMWNYITWDRAELEFQNNVRIWNKYNEKELLKGLGQEKFDNLKNYIEDWKKNGKGTISGWTGKMHPYEPYEWRFGGDLPKFQYKKSEVIDAGSGNTYTDVEGKNLVLDRESDARDYLNADLLSKGWDIRHANEIQKNIELGYDVGYGNEDETTDGIYNKYTKDFRINQLANTKEFLGRPIHYNAESFMDKLSLNKNYFRNVAGVSIPGHGISDEFNLMSDKWRAQEYPRIYYGENIGGRRLNIPTGYDFTNLRQHELGHAMLNNVEGITPYASELLTRSKTFSEDRSNISYKDWIAQGHGGPKPTRKAYRKWKNVSSGDYLTDDSEVYTRYKIAQKDLKNKGIFDAFSGKTFTDDDYNKVQEYINSDEYRNADSNVKQFFGNDEYDPKTGEYNKKIEKEDLIEIMNNVADLSTGMPAGMSKYGGSIPKFQTKGEYPAFIKDERGRKAYDQAMSKGWVYDTRLPLRTNQSGPSYFFTQDALDIELEKAGFDQTTHYYGRKLNKDGLLTLDQTQGDGINFIDLDINHEENNRMMKLINTGNWGYSPNTGQMIELNKPTKKQLTATQHVMDTEEFAKLTTGFGSTGNYSDEQEVIFDNLSKADKKIVKGLSKDQRKKWVANSMQEVYKNPITYAPGALYMGAVAGPTLLSWGSTDLIGGVAGTSLFDALGYWGAYHGITHGPEDVKEFIDDPSLSTGFDVAMDGLGIFGGGVAGYRGLGNLTKANKLYTSAVSPTKTPVLRATTFNKHGQIKTSFDDQLKVVNKSGYNEVVMEGNIPARDRLYNYHNGHFNIKVRGNQSIPNNSWNVQITKKGSVTKSKDIDNGFMQLVKSENGVYHLDMSMPNRMDAGQAIKYLSEYVPKGAIIKTAPNGSLSLDSYKLMTNQIKHGKFSYVPSDRTVQLNMMSKNMAKIDVNNAGLVTKTEADEIVKNVNKMLDKAGIKQRATATNVGANAKDYLNYTETGTQSLENFLTWKVEVPELAIKVKFKEGGELPKAQNSAEIDADGNIFMSQTTPINQQVVTSTSTKEDKKIAEKNRKQLIANSPTVEIADELGLFKNEEEKKIEIKNRDDNKVFNEEWDNTLDKFGNLDLSKVKNWSDEQTMYFYEQNKHDYLKGIWAPTPDKVRKQIDFYETDILWKNVSKPLLDGTLWLGETAVNSFSSPENMAITVAGGAALNKAVPYARGLFNKLKNSKYKGQSTTHTYNPKTRTWIENNANAARQNLLQNDIEFLVKQNYLTNKINTLQQGKIKIVADIKKFKLNNPNKPIPEDLLQVQRINTNQLIAYNKQLNNVPPTYNLYDEKKWVGPTLQSGNDDLIKSLTDQLKKAEKLDLDRMIGDYKWDDRGIFKKYFDTPKHPFNINSPGEKPFWIDYKEGGEVVKHTIVKGDTGKRLEAMYGTNLKDILKHNDLTYFKLGAEIEIPKYQDKGQFNVDDAYETYLMNMQMNNDNSEKNLEPISFNEYQRLSTKYGPNEVDQFYENEDGLSSRPYSAWESSSAKLPFPVNQVMGWSKSQQEKYYNTIYKDPEIASVMMAEDIEKYNSTKHGNTIDNINTEFTLEEEEFYATPDSWDPNMRGTGHYFNPFNAKERALFDQEWNKFGVSRFGRRIEGDGLGLLSGAYNYYTGTPNNRTYKPSYNFGNDAREIDPETNDNLIFYADKDGNPVGKFYTNGTPYTQRILDWRDKSGNDATLTNAIIYDGSQLRSDYERGEDALYRDVPIAAAVLTSPLWGPSLYGGLATAGTATYNAALPYTSSAIGGIEGLTLGNIFNASGIAYGGTHIGPDTYDFIKDPSWGGLGNIGIDALGLLGIKNTPRFNVPKVKIPKVNTQQVNSAGVVRDADRSTDFLTNVKNQGWKDLEGGYLFDETVKLPKYPFKSEEFIKQYNKRNMSLFDKNPNLLNAYKKQFDPGNKISLYRYTDDISQQDAFKYGFGNQGSYWGVGPSNPISYSKNIMYRGKPGHVYRVDVPQKNLESHYFQNYINDLRRFPRTSDKEFLLTPAQIEKYGMTSQPLDLHIEEMLKLKKYGGRIK